MLVCVACGNTSISVKINLKLKEVFIMLNENIKAIRKSKGFSQEDLAVKLNVVRQTISKWENGLSVPDSEMLLSISEELDVSVSTLLGENVAEGKDDELKVISEKLEVINLFLAQSRMRKRKIFHYVFILLFVLFIAIYIFIGTWHSPYLSWDYSDPETAVLGVALHGFEWLFVRFAPLVLIGAVVGIVKTRKIKR